MTKNKELLQNGQFLIPDRAVLGDAFTGTCITGVEPIVLFLGNIRVVGLVSANANDTVLEFGGRC